MFIIFKVFVYAAYTLFVVALGGLVYEGIIYNTIDKPLMKGCHFSLACEACDDCSLPRCERSDVVLCWQTTELR